MGSATELSAIDHFTINKDDKEQRKGFMTKTLSTSIDSHAR